MKLQKKYIKYVSFLPALIIMIIIFSFSAKPAVASNQTSSPIAEMLVSMWENVFGTITRNRVECLDTVNFLVRKVAHVTEYMVLALSINLPLCLHKLRGKKLFFISLAVSVMYAASDEFHQLFVEGRSGSIKDVGIDTIGIVIGCLLVLLFTHKKKKNLD